MPAKKEIIDGKVCCSKCGEWKEQIEENFQRRKAGKRAGTWEVVCRDCDKERRRQDWKKNPAVLSDEQKARNKEHARKRREAKKQKLKEEKEIAKAAQIIDGKKQCKKCETWKEINIDNFAVYNNGVYYAVCRECRNAEAREYRAKNPRTEEQIIRSKEANKIWRKNNRDRERELKRQWRAKNKQKTNDEYNQRIKNDISFRLREMVSKKVRNALKSRGASKDKKSVMDFLPYTIEELRTHLESLFEPWMTWENHGTHKKWDDNDPSTWRWQIDHIIPQSDLPFTSMEDENFKKAWALENLRPLSSKQNLSDGATRIRHNKVGITQHNNDNPISEDQ
jgi:hypothetical protein